MVVSKAVHLWKCALPLTATLPCGDKFPRFPMTKLRYHSYINRVQPGRKGGEEREARSAEPDDYHNTESIMRGSNPREIKAKGMQKQGGGGRDMKGSGVGSKLDAVRNRSGRRGSFPYATATSFTYQPPPPPLTPTQPTTTTLLLYHPTFIMSQSHALSDDQVTPCNPTLCIPCNPN